ncbi:hypothetical protein SASPL_110999 [Salvia splendens]|uniref:Mitochondrial import inner membrane translocase subunit TIM22 n=1 Tax=Salvia splendens TaxID=180675 RepID=A0A8X8Y5M4_SALSN|nr:hypothetical protein SASPL_110999 [Salvia splendens]
MRVLVWTTIMTSNPDSDLPNASSSQEESKPAIETIRLPTMDEIQGQDIWNNCAVRSVMSGVMGGGLGLAMGLFLGSFDTPLLQDQMTGRQQLVYQAKQMGQRSWSNCKSFALMGGPKAACVGCAGFAAFSVAIEKVLERYT